MAQYCIKNDVSFRCKPPVLFLDLKENTVHLYIHANLWEKWGNRSILSELALLALNESLRTFMNEPPLREGLRLELFLRVHSDYVAMQY